MTQRETLSGSGGDASTSRRAFLVMAGSAASVGLAAAPASGTDPEGAVTMDVTPPQRGAARAAVDRLRSARSSTGVPVRMTETAAGPRRFTAGDVDVLAGGRPLLPAERSRAAENGVDYERRELPTATAALRHPESSWVDCLSPNRLAETWAGDGSAETWAEVAPGTVTDALTRRPPSEASAAGAESSERTDPTPDGPVLVRGVRSHQYASGFGGLGYYEPEGDLLGDRDGDADSHTPLVRLTYLYVDRESVERREVKDLVRAYARQSAERVGDRPYFEDPIGA